MQRAILIATLLTACGSGLPATDSGLPGPDGGATMRDDASSLDGGIDAPDGGREPDADPPDGRPPVAAGRWPPPESTFTLPTISEGAGYHYPDIQASFPDVDWSRLDRLYIPAGRYRFIRIGNLPARDPARPLVITNRGGQVRVGGFDHHFVCSIGGGSGWVLTGRYDSVAQTGDEAFPGHRGGAYANSRDTYGILIDDDFVRAGNNGITVGGRATRFELEYLELREIGFAAVMLKTDNDGAAAMDGVDVHDLYIHDIGSEGFYIGSTQRQPQHPIVGLTLHHNRVLRTGTEAIQIGQLRGRIEVHNNVFGPSAIDWRAAFQRFQDGNLQIAVRSGTVDVHHNVFLGGAGAQASIFGEVVSGDPHDPSDRVWIHDNYYAHYRNLFTYVAARTLSPMTFRFERNTMRGWRFDYDEVYGGSAPGEMIRVGGSETVVEVVGNRFDVTGPRLVGSISDPDGNGTSGNVSGSGNVRGTVEPIRFRASGLPNDFDYLDLEMWTDVATLGGDRPVAYRRGMVVMHRGVPYRCGADPCAAGRVPPEHPSIWTELPLFPDDVRLAPGSPHAGVGIDR